MPTKTLPASPSLDHLKHQAKDLIRDHAARLPEALQRIREFHPRFHRSTDEEIGDASLSLVDAQLAIAREYGFRSWTRLKSQVENHLTLEADRPYHERIDDPEFRRAVELLDSGDEEGLRAHLSAHPELVTKRLDFEGGNYFRNPSLLEFVAENPVRNDALPPNIARIAAIILDAGARHDQRSIDGTLELVCSGRVPRERGVQVPLIDLLCDYGANPNAAMIAALGHGEFEAVDALLRRGADLDLVVAAATGRMEEAKGTLDKANPEQRHLALAFAAQHGHADIVRLLLDAGEDPNRYNPVGAHSHSTPLHQAALEGYMDVVKLLVERGARLDIRDIMHNGTPQRWAEYAGRSEAAEYLARAAGA